MMKYDCLVGGFLLVEVLKGGDLEESIFKLFRSTIGLPSVFLLDVASRARVRAARS